MGGARGWWCMTFVAIDFALNVRAHQAKSEVAQGAKGERALAFSDGAEKTVLRDGRTRRLE